MEGEQVVDGGDEEQHQHNGDREADGSADLGVTELAYQNPRPAEGQRAHQVCRYNSLQQADPQQGEREPHHAGQTFCGLGAGVVLLSAGVCCVPGPFDEDFHEVVERGREPNFEEAGEFLFQTLRQPDVPERECRARSKWLLFPTWVI